MNPKIIIILWLTFWIIDPALAGYRDLKNEYDSYGPPAYFTDQFRPAPESQQPDADELSGAEQQRLEEMKAGWERTLKIDGNEAAFLVPDSGLVEYLKPAQTDAAAAADAVKDIYSLKHLETLALLRNSGVKAAENRFRGSLEAFTQVSALDQILRKYTAFTEDLMTGVGPMKGKEPMRTKFPFPGVSALKGQIVHQQVLAESESLEISRRDVVTDVRMAYWNLVYLIRSKRITADMCELLKHIEAVANARYEAGKTSYQDVMKIRINRKILEEELTTLAERQRNVESKIREIINLPADAALGSPDMILPPAEIPPLDRLYDMARDRRQELRRQRSMVGKTERMIAMAETMILPSYTMNFSLYEDEAVNMTGSLAKKDAFPVQTEAATGAGLPRMPWYGVEDAYLRETRQKLDALKADLNNAEVSTLTMVRSAWFELDRAQRETNLYHNDIVHLSRSALEVSARGYESGKVSFADVIDSYMTWLRANLMLARNQSDLGVARAKLEQFVGVSFD